MGRELSQKETKLSNMIEDRFIKDELEENRRKFYLLKAKENELLLRLNDVAIFNQIQELRKSQSGNVTKKESSQKVRMFVKQQLETGMISIHAYRDKSNRAWVKAKPEDAARIEQEISYV